MIQHFQERFHRAADLCVIVNPADFRIDFAFYGNFDLEAVAVHTAAFVAGRRVWQGLRRFKREVFRQTGAHDAQSITNLTPVSSRTKWGISWLTQPPYKKSVRYAQTPRCVGFQMNLCI